MKLVERDECLRVLNEHLDGASCGAGCIVLVCGEAGIGKTSLVRQFVDQHHETARILWGGCEALFTPHPLAPLHDIARQVGQTFAAAVSAAGSRGEIFNLAMDELVRGAAPTILVFEDVHWADEATLDLVKYIGRRLEQLGVLVVISFRDDELGTLHPLHTVIGDLPARYVYRLQVPALTRTAVATLARMAGRSSAGHLHDITGGNPFFVTEVLAGAEDELPPTVRDAVMARIARLSKPARAVANLVALTPGRTERWLLEKALGVDDRSLQACVGIGMVALPDGAFAFRHELARRAAEESLSLPTRQRLHAQILGILLADPRPEIGIARLVHHADGAGNGDAVLRYAPVAATQAAALGAHREAAAHYATVLRYAPSHAHAQKAEWFELRSYECYLTDQMLEAISAREASLALWRIAGESLREGDGLRWLSRLCWYNGQTVAAEQHAAQAIEVLESLLPGRELAMAYSNRAQLHMLAGDTAATLHWGGKALALARELGDREVEIHALNNMGTTKLSGGDPSGRADLEQSLVQALEGQFEEHAARAFTNLSSQAVRACDYNLAKMYLDRGLGYCEERDLDAWAHYMTACRAEVCLAQGDWDRATELADAICRRTCVAPITRIPALAILGRIRARRGDPGVWSALGEARELAEPTGEIQRIGPVAVARAEAAWLNGQHAEVIVEAGSAYALAVRQKEVWVLGELACWLWRADALASVPEGIAPPFALQIAGDWRAAASEWERLGSPYQQAMALADSTDEQALRQALAIFEQLGAAPMASIVRRTLRTHGVRDIPRGAQQRTQHNPHGLTKQELKVLGLLVEGCRNADIARRIFVSEKTVDHHVSAVLAKLGVRSRGEAAAAAMRFGLGVAPANGKHP
jgi:DNA-binding CsgD family transcriptional regulator/tetratricopeptide (TPR) repeat protein